MATTVIVGSGIIGLSTAFYLSKHQPGSSIHLVDVSPELFTSASGNAGGFIARKWFGPGEAALGELSFQEHKILAEKEDGHEKWGYSKTVVISYDPRGKWADETELTDEEWEDENHDWLRNGSTAEKEYSQEEVTINGTVPKWLKRYEDDEVSRTIDNGDGAAIVDPLKLCKFLLEKCKDAGVHIYNPATALNVTADLRGDIASVRIGYTDSSTEIEVPATRILLSAGCWTPQVFKTLFKDSAADIPVAELGGHSITVKMPEGTMDDDKCHAVYCNLGTTAPEIYARSNGVIYVGGMKSFDLRLPKLPSDAEPLESAFDELKLIARRLIKTDDGKDPEIVRSGLCFRPMSLSNKPFLCRVGDENLGQGIATRPGAEGGVFIAAGHGPWGISWSLGTGKVMAEMMQGREMSIDLSQLTL